MFDFLANKSDRRDRNSKVLHSADRARPAKAGSIKPCARVAIYISVSAMLLPSTRVRWLEKHLGICKQEVVRLGAALPDDERIYCDVQVVTPDDKLYTESEAEAYDNDPRPGRRRLLFDIEAGKIDVVLIEYVSDLGVQRLPVISFLHALMDKNVDLYSTKYGQLPLLPEPDSGDPIEEFKRSLSRVWALQDSMMEHEILLEVLRRKREAVPRELVRRLFAE